MRREIIQGDNLIDMRGGKARIDNINEVLGAKLAQLDAACCSVLQRVAVCCRVLHCVAVCCNVLQCVAVCCSVLQCVAMYCNMLQCIANILQCVAVYCSVIILSKTLEQERSGPIPFVLRSL